MKDNTVAKKKLKATDDSPSLFELWRAGSTPDPQR